MVSAVSSAGGAALRSYGATSAVPADGQAQLQRLQHQLSDNVNCASASTREGKANIADIQGKISALKHQMQDPPAPTSTAPSVGTSGGLIDVYA